MADANLTQAEGDALIAMAKYRVDMTEWDYPDLGGVISVPLFSADRRENFLLDVRRGPNRSCEGNVSEPRAAGRGPGEARLRRSAPPESGRGGARLASSPSLSEGFGDKWAIPVPGDVFGDVTDQWRTLQDFMQYCNIAEIPLIRRGLFT
jgi:hypothetical protein